MLTISIVSLVVTAITLTMALEFVLIIIWHNTGHASSYFLIILFATIALWGGGTLFELALSIVNPTNIAGSSIAIGITWVGYTSSILAIYAFTASLVNLLSRRFKSLLLVSWVVLLMYQAALLLQVEVAGIRSPNIAQAPLGNIPTAFYLLFLVATIYLFWRYRVRIVSVWMRLGLMLFLSGQLIGLFNATSPVMSLAVSVCSLACLLLAVSVVRQEIIVPLKERTSQVESMHNMSLAITSQLSLQFILRQIASQTLERLAADAACVFLKQDDGIQIAAVDNLPSKLIETWVSPDGIAGRVIRTGQPVQLENYERSWQQEHDIPFAAQTFGSVICVPLIYAEATIGALMAISGKRKRAFQADDARLLGMLGAQAAVAIQHGQLFKQQRILNDEIASARNQLETLLTSTENPVIAVDRQLHMIFANNAAERLFPDLCDQQTEKPVTALLPAVALPDDLFPVIRNIRRHRVHTYEIVYRDRVYRAHLAALEEAHGIEGWVAVLNDITDLKELDRLKSEMVRMTSHDLKNPLQAAIAHLDLLTDSIAEKDQDDIDYSLKILEKQLLRMYRIISGVLDVERVRAGVRTIKTASPQQVLQGAIEDMQPLAEDQHIRIESYIQQPVPNIQADAGQLQRALVNLIENAIKFTPKGGAINICTYAEHNNVVFSVADNGIGIPKENHSKLFDSFYRANQKGAEHITGTGLGLHLVKTIVENHAGQVWLESEEKIGTTFYISIPIRSNGIV